MNSRLIDIEKKNILEVGDRLKYPTGERVPVKCKLSVRVELGKYSSEMPMFVADIAEDCILGADFFSQTGMDEIFRSSFQEFLQQGKQENFFVVRLVSFQKKFQTD